MNSRARRSKEVARAVADAGEIDPALVGRIEGAGQGASQLLTAVSRNLDSAQVLVGDRDTRNALLLTRHVDADGAAALLDRATARMAPTAADAEQNAAISRDLFTDLAGDPYGWREHIERGGPISTEIAMIAAERIDAFSSTDASSAPEVFPAAATAGGFQAHLSLGARDGQDVLTFVGAGRDPAAGADRESLAMHTAAQLYTRDQVALAATGHLDPATALGRAGAVTDAVNTAHFRTAMHAYGDADAAAQSVYDNVTTAAGIPLDRAVELAAGAAPGFVGDALSIAVDKAVEGFEPEATAGENGTQITESIRGRQHLDLDHLLVSTYQQIGALPPDTPGLAAVTDPDGQVSTLDSFRDDTPDYVGAILADLGITLPNEDQRATSFSSERSCSS